MNPAVGTRKRPRKPRVRREPIDLEQLAAEFADLPDPPEFRSMEPGIDEQEILVALQAEVQRVQAARVIEEPEPVCLPAPEPELAPESEPEPELDLVSEPEPEPEPESEPDGRPFVVDPFGIVEVASDERVPVVLDASRVGLPLDQVRAWLERVQEDLRRIQSRLQYLEAEQMRLQEQHHIVAELLTSSTPV